MDQSVVAPYPEVSVFVTRNGIDDRIVEATEQRRQAVVPFVQLVDTFRIVEIGIVFVIGDGQKSADDVLSLLFGGNPESAFVQVVLIDVVAEQQHVVGAVLIQVDRFSPIAEAVVSSSMIVNGCFSPVDGLKTNTPCEKSEISSLSGVN